MSGKMSRQIVPAKHRSFRIQIRTQRFESNQFIIVSHFVPLIHYRPVHCIVHVLTIMYWPFPTCGKSQDLGVAGAAVRDWQNRH